MVCRQQHHALAAPQHILDDFRVFESKPVDEVVPVDPRAVDSLGHEFAEVAIEVRGDAPSLGLGRVRKAAGQPFAHEAGAPAEHPGKKREHSTDRVQHGQRQQ